MAVMPIAGPHIPNHGSRVARRSTGRATLSRPLDGQCAVTGLTDRVILRAGQIKRRRAMIFSPNLTAAATQRVDLGNDFQLALTDRHHVYLDHHRAVAGL